MTIKKMTIKNVRGIEHFSIDSQILKNRPHILIAPNGFGKTSIATAFKSAASQTSIKLCNEDYHKHDENNCPIIELELEENNITQRLSVTKDAHSNEIRKNIDIHVISDLQEIKTTSRWVAGGHRIPKAKMVINPIVICKKIKKTESPYKISEIKSSFGRHGKILPNIKNSLFQSYDFIMRSTECLKHIGELNKTRNTSKINAVAKKLSCYSGSTEDALLHVSPLVDELLEDLKDASDLACIMRETAGVDNIKAFLSIFQLVYVYKTHAGALKSHLEYLRYSEIKNSLNNTLTTLNTSWKEFALKEINGNLIVEMPDPKNISNGQRDVLALCSMLHIARYNLTKSKAILIIDEVFDYLDDANITVAQYFTSLLIDDYKRQGRSIYVIILTHLNPSFFSNYVFSNQRHIYLDNGTKYDSTDAMKKLIGARSNASLDASLKDNIAKHLVHYYSGDYDFSESLSSIHGVRSSWGKRGKFQKFIKDEFKKYIANQAYDPLAICAITRLSIEELAFRQISTHPEASIFFEVRKTGQKLDWAIHRGATVPEAHYLLRIIFDDGMHWNLNKDNTIPIVAKLSHPIIKKMIKEAVEQCLTDDPSENSQEVAHASKPPEL